MSSNLTSDEIAPMENQNVPVEQVRNWLALPCDLMLLILMKVGSFGILESAQFVCKVWYTLCKEPVLWRIIHIRNIEFDPDMLLVYEKMVFNAIDRSAGGLIGLSIEGFGSDELCSYIPSQSSQLKHLRLANCNDISFDKALVEALKKLSSLEELELTLCDFEKGAPVSVINSCPCLTTFKFNNLGSKSPYVNNDEEALAIAASMPQLRHLQLIGNNMTNVGLTAILDSCLRLQSIDLRACYHLDLEGDLGKRLSEQIKDLRHPYDSTQDYNFPTTEDDHDDRYHDYWQYVSKYLDCFYPEPDSCDVYHSYDY
ncbi:F-box protein SKIP19-like [Silene latifolia]|uniref:F-box protein SKIP19-like n=1 Tax=Silene latifolia TaxID=37657 RepID=UPI003D773774